MLLALEEAEELLLILIVGDEVGKVTELQLLVSPTDIVVAEIKKHKLLRVRTFTDATLTHLLTEIILHVRIYEHIKVTEKNDLVYIIIAEVDEQLPELREDVFS